MKTIRLLFLFSLSMFFVLSLSAQDEAGDPTVGTLPLFEKVPVEGIEHVEILPVDNPVIDCEKAGRAKFMWTACIAAADEDAAEEKAESFITTFPDNFILRIIFSTAVNCKGCILPHLTGCNPNVISYEITASKPMEKGRNQFSVTYTAKIKAKCTRCEG